MIKIILFLICVLIEIGAIAQQKPSFSQYYVNDMLVNPAVSGSKNFNPLTFQTRQQWLGFEGAPLTSIISYHGAVNNRSAFGGYLMFDRAYPATNGNFQFNYAYHLQLDDNYTNLSFGIGAKLMYHNLDFNDGDLPPGEDPAFSYNSYDKLLSDASSGVYLYSRNFYAGFSVSNILQSTFNDPVSNSPYSNSVFRNYYAMGMYRFKILNNDWNFEPSFLIRKMQFTRNITDLTARFLYREDTWAGLTYRTNKTAVFSFGFVANKMCISYSYDHTFSGTISKESLGSHELGIILRIPSYVTDRRLNF